MKIMWKMPLLLVMVMVLAVGMSFSANAAETGVEKKPYEYDFITNPGVLYNGFSGAKELVITFDKAITKVPTISEIRVLRVGSDAVLPAEVLPIIDLQVQSVGKTLTIKFKNLEFIDTSKGNDFKVVIDPKVLYADQLTPYEFPFKFHDLLPGFASTFLDPSKAGLINTNIFKQNEPRLVMVHVPPLYLTKIETIHRNEGIFASGKAPSLSNIDVLANAEATRLKVNFAGKTFTDPSGRDLERSSSKLNGFSMGQAGIEDLVCSDADKKAGTTAKCLSKDEIYLTAFNKDGRLLATKKFKMEVKNKEKDFKVSDYIKASEKNFGKAVSLYDLMATPKLLEEIMKGIEVSSLNNLGVSYSLGDTIQVDNLEQFEMALKNDDFKTIQLKKDILLTNELTIDRSVTIEGNNKSLTGVGANLILGKGDKNLTITVKDLTVGGVIEVNVGATGTAVLNGTTATDTIIVSGGTNSVHFINFTSTNPIELKNTTPVRIVTNKKVSAITINGTNTVILEGLYGIVTVENTSGKLIMKHNTVIDTIENKKDDDYTISAPNGIAPTTIEGNVVIESIEGPPGVVPGVPTKIYMKNKIELKIEPNIKLDDILHPFEIGNDSAQIDQLKGIKWTVQNPDLFESGTITKYEDGGLKITGQISTSIESVNLILIGTSSTEVQYEVTIPIKVIVTVTGS